jgi:hypothetical protein
MALGFWFHCIQGGIYSLSELDPYCLTSLSVRTVVDCRWQCLYNRRMNHIDLRVLHMLGILKRDDIQFLDL